MVPIHETDVAAERWSQAEWENYELWEKVELRLARKRRLWILSTILIFIALSAVPIVLERWPKWTTRSLTRQLAQEINRIKWDAIVNRAAYRIRFNSEGGLEYSVEKLTNCSDPKAEVVRTSSLRPSESASAYSLVSMKMGQRLGIVGLVNEFCYDNLNGSGATLMGESLVGFGFIPVKDLAEQRSERVSTLLLSGPSAEMSFE